MGQASSQLIGIDLGGTAIKLGRFDRQGRLLAEHQRPTPQPAMPGAVTLAIVEAVQQLDPDGLASSVGIGLPGPMDAAGRVARVCINLPGWRQVPSRIGWSPSSIGGSPWRTMAMRPGGRPGTVRPRASAMCSCSPLGPVSVAECCLGGQLFSGHGGAAAEPGLIGVDPDGPPCNSGNRGRSSSTAASAASGVSRPWIS